MGELHFRPSFGSVSGREYGGGIHGGPRLAEMGGGGPRWGVGAAAAAEKPWGGLTDPEMKRRRRVAMYKVYSIQGRVKASLRRGFRWVKAKCSDMVHGY